MVRMFYLDDYREHPLSGESTTDDTNSEPDWSDWVSTLSSDGWRGGAVQSIEVEATNQNTVTIRTRWSNSALVEAVEDESIGVFCATSK